MQNVLCYALRFHIQFCSKKFWLILAVGTFNWLATTSGFLNQVSQAELNSPTKQN